MNIPFQITIPANVLVDKVNSYPMVMWVVIEKVNDVFIDLLTNEEKEDFVKTSNWEDNDLCPTRIEKVELTLGDLLTRGTDDEV